MSDGGWYGYPPQEPDPYAQPQDDWNRPPLDYGNAAQASGYDAYGRQAQQAQAQQAQYYAQQQAQQQAQAQQAEQAARARAQQYGRQQQQQQPQQQHSRQQQPGQSQNPYFQQQQQQQQQQQGYGYEGGGYAAQQQYSTGQQQRIGYEGYQQSGYEQRGGYDTSAGYANQGYESASNYEQAGYGSGAYDATAQQAEGTRAAQGGRGGAAERRRPRDPYVELGELSEDQEGEYEYPNRAARRGETTGQQAKVEDEDRFNLLGEERAGRGRPSTSTDDDEDDDDGEGKKKGRRSCLVIFLFFALIAGGLGYGSYQGYKYYESHYGPPADYSSTSGISETAIVVIPSSATGSDIGTALFNAGVIKSQRAFTEACKANSQCSSIQAATYQLHKQMSAASALTALLNPANIYNKSQLLVRPGERASDVFADLEQKKNWTQAQIVAAVNSGQVDLPSYALAKAGTKFPFANIEGLLYTGTYQLTSYSTPQALIKSMVDQQVKMFNAIGLTQKASSLKMTPYQVLTVASMARAEAGDNPSDLGKIAGVIYTRLKNPNYSKLGFDTATLYGLGRTTPQPTASELADRSNPYNLRVIAGLPPGPIDSVDQIALTNALAPTDNADVFFCAVDGTVHYASSNAAWAALGRQYPGSCG